MLNTDSNRYNEYGYYICPDVLSHTDVTRFRTLLDDMISKLGADERPEGLSEPHVAADSWQDWLELCRHPAILDAVEQALGPNLVLLMSHLIVKRANDGYQVQWHQDNTYWASVTGTDVTTCWLAIDDSDKENACLQVIPSTHDYTELPMVTADDNNLLTVRVDVDEATAAQAVHVELPAGSMSLHDSYILHGSDANTSSRRRAGFTMRYANAASVQVDVANHGKPVYYVRGDTAYMPEGARDIRLGTSLPEHPGEHVSQNSRRSAASAQVTP